MKYITKRAVTTIAMVQGNETKHPIVIIKGRRMQWVGIGWVDEGKATVNDKTKYPQVKE